MDEAYLCRHLEPWYSQELRPPASFCVRLVATKDQEPVTRNRFFGRCDIGVPSASTRDEALQTARAILLVTLGIGSQKVAFDLRQIASINGFLFLGKTSIKSAPYNVEEMLPIAREFWTTVLQSLDWKREGTLLREPAVLKGLAKSWFYVFLARRNNQFPKAEKLRAYVRRTQFDKAWMESVEGLSAHTVPADTPLGFRFSPAHNDIVAKVVAAALA